jgi:hypothetical protein
MQSWRPTAMLTIAGLSEIYRSEKSKIERNRLFVRPRRIYHNGIVKGPSKKGGKSIIVTMIKSPDCSTFIRKEERKDAASKLYRII